MANITGGEGIRKPPLDSTSWSLTYIDPDSKYDHAWSITDFTKKMQMRNKSLSSGEFTLETKNGPSHWFLMIHPNKTGTFEQSVGFYLVRKDDGPSVTLDYTLSIVDKFGEKEKSLTYRKTFKKKFLNYKKLSRSLFHQSSPNYNCGHGADKFLDHFSLRLRQNSLLPNDTLTVLCEISIENGDRLLTGGTNKPIIKPVVPDTVNDNKLNQDFEKMFLSGNFHDCLIVCDGGEFKCHKVILSGRSSVFAAMFAHDMKENQENRVEIKDLDGDTVYGMILFIYSGKVDKLTTKAFRDEFKVHLEPFFETLFKSSPIEIFCSEIPFYRVPLLRNVGCTYYWCPNKPIYFL